MEVVKGFRTVVLRRANSAGRGSLFACFVLAGMQWNCLNVHQPSGITKWPGRRKPSTKDDREGRQKWPWSHAGNPPEWNHLCLSYFLYEKKVLCLSQCYFEISLIWCWAQIFNYIFSITNYPFIASPMSPHPLPSAISTLLSIIDKSKE